MTNSSNWENKTTIVNEYVVQDDVTDLDFKQ